MVLRKQYCDGNITYAVYALLTYATTQNIVTLIYTSATKLFFVRV